MPAAAILRNVLLLEQQRGFDDRAVVGGLLGLVRKLDTHLTISAVSLDRLRRYADASPAERRQVVEILLGELGAFASSAPSTGFPTDSAPRNGRRSSSGSVTPSPGTPRAPKPNSRLNPSTPLSALPGVGPARARRLASLDLHTAGDLVGHFPNRYIFYPPPKPASHLGFEELASFEGTVDQLYETRLPGNRRRISAVLRDSTGSVGANWIRGGRGSLGIREGMRLAVSGPLIRYGRQVSFENPDYEPADRIPVNTRRPVPVYPLTAGISQLFLRALVWHTRDQLLPAEESLPAWLLKEEGLIGRQAALDGIHGPDSPDALAAAKQRLAFDELLPLELIALDRRRRYQAEPAPAINVPWRLLADVCRDLPFSLTGGQQRALSALLDDLASRRPMVRLLQGDVGSGKTVVAAMALLAAIASGFQAALLAPTEILAEQHFRTLTRLFEAAQDTALEALGHRIRLRLLSSALTRKARGELLDAIRRGDVDIVVGTHAVIQSDVEFPSLALAVVDEQHRFGVEQRVALRAKGQNPHLLVMTATPIPRTLALTIYGDLDISYINEMPPGRQPVETILIEPDQRRRAYDRIRSDVARGHQAFIICPLVDGSGVVEAKAATREYDRLKETDLKGLRLALLHGRMRPALKDDVMRQFADGAFDVLVSTPVVEVGVDVPNATVMLIEGADRFGLAQLHQFRGRIGRGSDPAKCFAVPGGESGESLARLEALASSNNGLELAEADLRIRGPGDYFGVRQSGFPALRIADITDAAFVQRVREAAKRVLARDPELEQPEHSGLAALVRELTDEVQDAN
ncbi:MAG: ATP-dependent DNA helicase RecG [Chloroflexi bacterium]|nr:ATP-dependent DNA helicase RecG [Chloroflexota bacterium]